MHRDHRGKTLSKRLQKKHAPKAAGKTLWRIRPNSGRSKAMDDLFKVLRGNFEDTKPAETRVSVTKPKKRGFVFPDLPDDMAENGNVPNDEPYKAKEQHFKPSSEPATPSQLNSGGVGTVLKDKTNTMAAPPRRAPNGFKDQITLPIEEMSKLKPLEMPVYGLPEPMADADDAEDSDDDVRAAPTMSSKNKPKTIGGRMARSKTQSRIGAQKLTAGTADAAVKKRYISKSAPAKTWTPSSLSRLRDADLAENISATQETQALIVATREREMKHTEAEQARRDAKEDEMLEIFRRAEHERLQNLPAEQAKQDRKAKVKARNRRYTKIEDAAVDEDWDKCPTGKLIWDGKYTKVMYFAARPGRKPVAVWVEDENFVPLALGDSHLHHVLPYPKSKDSQLDSQEKTEHAIECVLAQLPELQLQAAANFLDEEELEGFTKRCFGDNAPSSCHEQTAHPVLWAKVSNFLSRYEPFMAAARLYAAGEPTRSVYDSNGCWPEYFIDRMKAKACDPDSYSGADDDDDVSVVSSNEEEMDDLADDFRNTVDYDAFLAEELGDEMDEKGDIDDDADGTQHLFDAWKRECSPSSCT